MTTLLLTVKAVVDLVACENGAAVLLFMKMADLADQA